MPKPSRYQALDKPRALPNPEDYLSAEQRWDEVAAILANLVWQQMEAASQQESI